MNPGFAKLQPYPFERLRQIQQSVVAADREPINLSIGEPKHPTPAFIQDALIEAIDGTAKYPSTRGSEALRRTVAGWASRRFNLPNSCPLDPDRHVLPVNGTREALFAIAQCVVDRSAKQPVVAMPNPFYQIYEGAALLAGATPYFLTCSAENAFVPDFDAVADDVWRSCQLVYVCSPGNPSGAEINRAHYRRLIELADEFDFLIVADECYSELYYDEKNPPVGLLEVAGELGRADFARCLVMHSLSKRSNAPGLRSGFVAGDPAVIEKFFEYRTYHGSAMPLHVQNASIAAWSDEIHVVANRALYRDKFDAVLPVFQRAFDVERPPAGFYLWPKVPIDDITFCRRAIAEQNVLVLPGQFLARDCGGSNPGRARVRVALVEDLKSCVEGAERLVEIR